MLLPLLSSDLFTVMQSCVDGCLNPKDITWHSGAAATIVGASPGYPQSYPKGVKMTGLETTDPTGESDVTVYHAGTKVVDGEVVTSGGRVIAVTGRSATLRGALRKAYSAMDSGDGSGGVGFEGMHYRRDIAWRALKAPLRIGVLGSTRGTDLQVRAATTRRDRDATRRDATRRDARCDATRRVTWPGPLKGGSEGNPHPVTLPPSHPLTLSPSHPRSQAIIDAIEAGSLDATVSLVVSNRDTAPILERATKHGITNQFIGAKGKSREEYDGEWVYGKRHGNGSYTYHDGGKYDGEWVDDKVRAAAPPASRALARAGTQPAAR